MYYIRRSQTDTYLFDWKKLSSNLTKEVRILLSFQQGGGVGGVGVDQAIKKFCVKLRQNGVIVRIYICEMQSPSSCLMCRSLPVINNKDLFSN